MSMVVREGADQSSIDAFCKGASRISLSQVVENITVKERLMVTDEARRMQFLVDIHFYPEDEYQEEYQVKPTEVLASFGVKFPSLLKKEITAEVKKLDMDMKSRSAELGQGKRVGAQEKEVNNEEENENENENDDEPRNSRKRYDGESDAGDGDAEDAKRASRRKEQATYESDEEDPDYGEYEPQENGIERAEPDTTAAETGGDEELGAASIADMFQSYFPLGGDFTFGASKCSFSIEVCYFADSCHSAHELPCPSFLAIH